MDDFIVENERGIPKSEWIARWYDWLDIIQVLASQTMSIERQAEIQEIITSAKVVIVQVADEVYKRKL